MRLTGLLIRVVDAFLAAARGGDFNALLAVLSPDVALRPDQAALVAGSPGAVWAPGGVPRVVFVFSITSGKISELEVIADRAHIAELELVMLS